MSDGWSARDVTLVSVLAVSLVILLANIVWLAQPVGLPPRLNPRDYAGVLDKKKRPIGVLYLYVTSETSQIMMNSTITNYYEMTVVTEATSGSTESKRSGQ